MTHNCINEMFAFYKRMKYLHLLLYIYLFIFKERERERASKHGGGAE